ncbi:hypothetical protein [Sulfobacillus harzensis]|uniref:DUF3574 domain-containing protein n=1 Tax=Sulfobacillus harzensis TaxID=2729629 RepID=A0A7Y0L136_9FIRM|nr:hypothetical protein [Sulfobacillus harzensis]NMP20801.1 hypothetical protein [Sulfobacillus harzensis]
MIKTTILVPVADNEGQPFTAADARWLLREALTRFGGITQEGTVEGQWAEGDVTYTDRSTRYTIALNSWRQVPDWLAFVDAIRERYRQIAIYGEVAGIPEIFSG